MVQARVPEWAWVIEQLEWAEQILEYEVSADEFRHALHEIEQLVQPVLQKAQHHMERRPLNQDSLDKDPLDKDSLENDCLDKDD
jgi:hypothetical protein